MALITNIIDALKRVGTSTQKTALQRLDAALENRTVLDKRQRVARSELGASPMFVATIEPPEESVMALTDEELVPILENAALVNGFIESLLGRTVQEHFLDDLDTAFGIWMESKDKKEYSEDAVIEIAGAAFGKYCADTLNMRWIRVVDDVGTDIGVQGRTKNFRGFPYAAIAKRIPTGEYGFFKPIYITLQDAQERDWAEPSAT